MDKQMNERNEWQRPVQPGWELIQGFGSRVEALLTILGTGEESAEGTETTQGGPCLLPRVVGETYA